MTPEPVESCAKCGTAFIPNQRQLGQKLRGRHLYCSTECMTVANHLRRQAFSRSDAGRAYARNRYAAKKLTKSNRRRAS